MPLFSRGGASRVDSRHRDYILRDEPLVTADDRVVLMNLVVRFEAAQRHDGPTPGWRADGEEAVHAVVRTILRLTAETVTHDAAMQQRSRLADPLTHALDLAPVASGFTGRVTSLEVRDHDAGARGDHEFRVVG